MNLLHDLINDIARFVRYLTYAIAVGFILGAAAWTFLAVSGLLGR